MTSNEKIQHLKDVLEKEVPGYKDNLDQKKLKVTQKAKIAYEILQESLKGGEFNVKLYRDKMSQFTPFWTPSYSNDREMLELMRKSYKSTKNENRTDTTNSYHVAGDQAETNCLLSLKKFFDENFSKTKVFISSEKVINGKPVVSLPEEHSDKAVTEKDDIDKHTDSRVIFENDTVVSYNIDVKAPRTVGAMKRFRFGEMVYIEFLACTKNPIKSKEDEKDIINRLRVGSTYADDVDFVITPFDNEYIVIPRKNLVMFAEYWYSVTENHVKDENIRNSLYKSIMYKDLNGKRFSNYKRLPRNTFTGREHKLDAIGRNDLYQILEYFNNNNLDWFVIPRIQSEVSLLAENSLKQKLGKLFKFK